VQSALAPLGTVYAAELHLSRVQVGGLFVAASIAMVVVTFPIGLVTDRLGARRLTVGAAALVALSSLGQGLAQAWAASTVIAPLAGGAIVQTAGDRAAFTVLVPITLRTGAWLLAVERPRAARALRRAARSHR
jgi:MFS family permease